MALALTKENFFWHKVHSLTGVVPIGFYMVQHLTLNSFSVAGPEKFNQVIGFFESWPTYLLLTVEVFLLWLPILFHAVYGLFIYNRAQPNYFTTKYKWSQNRMFSFQRYTGVWLFLFLIYHIVTTTGFKYAQHSPTPIMFDAWHDKLTSYGYVFLIIYMISIAAASYHLSYGIWNFCIRWGITISEKAQVSVQKFSLGAFIVITLIGWAALFGFLIPHSSSGVSASRQPVVIQAHA